MIDDRPGGLCHRGGGFADQDAGGRAGVNRGRNVVYETEKTGFGLN